jgi:hypothetical protein
VTHSWSVTNKFWGRVDDYPPVLCRLMAKHRPGPAMTTKEIADKSGLSEYEVLALSEMTSWKAVDLETFRRFTFACGVDFLDSISMKYVRDYLRKRPVRFKYLKTTQEWDDYFVPLIKKWRQSYAIKRGISEGNR